MRSEGRVMKEGDEGREAGEHSWSREEGHQRTALWGMSLQSRLSPGKEVGPSAVIMEKPLGAS